MSRPDGKRIQSLSCRDAQGYLADHVDGTLSAELAASLESHLETCESCKVEHEALAGLLPLLESEGTKDPGDDFFREMNRRVHGEIDARRRWSIRDLAPKPSFSPVFAAAALMLFLLLWWTLPDARRDGSIQPFLAQLEREAQSSLVDLSHELAVEGESVRDLLPSASSDEMIAKLSDSQLERLAERLEDLMG